MADPRTNIVDDSFFTAEASEVEKGVSWLGPR
jgi:hypothetical protein